MALATPAKAYTEQRIGGWEGGENEGESEDILRGLSYLFPRGCYPEKIIEKLQL